MNIITGYRAEAHITAQQDRDVNAGVFGTGIYILNIGSKLAATVISANEVQIADGVIVAEGCAAEVPSGTTESMTIANGEQGMKRKDLIVLRYTKNSGTGVENMQLIVRQGTSAASSPATPSYVHGSIANGDTIVDFPLYTVNISGITIQSVTGHVSVSPQVGSTAFGTEASTISGAIHELYLRSVNDRSTLTTLVSKIGSAVMGTTASTITGAIAELLLRSDNDRTKIGSSAINTQAQTIIGAINELLLRSENDRTKIGSSAINTQAQTIIGAINELLLRSQNDRTAASELSSKVTALETKTDGLVRVTTYTVASGANDYKQLSAISMYMLIVNGASTSDACRGLYLIGVTSNSTLGIKAVSAASGVTVTDGGSGLLKVTNNAGLTLRATLITTYA